MLWKLCNAIGNLTLNSLQRIDNSSIITPVNGLMSWLTLLIILFGLTSQKTHHQGGLGLGVLVHEEAYPCFYYFTQPPE